MILQAGAWPLSTQTAENQFASTSTEPTFQIPAMLKTSLDYFEIFYNEQHTGRKLSWLYANSTGKFFIYSKNLYIVFCFLNYFILVEVKINCLDKPYVVSMNVYQISILFLFSSEDSVSVETIVSKLSIPLPMVLKCIKGFIEIGLLLCDSVIF